MCNIEIKSKPRLDL